MTDEATQVQRTDDAVQGTDTGDQGSQAQADDKHDSRIKELSEEAKGYRLKLREAEAEVEKARSEFEEFKKQAATTADERKHLESALTEARIDNAIVVDAIGLGFYDPSDAVRLVTRDGVEMKDGKPVGVKEALTALAKAKPHLLRDTGAEDAGARGSGPSRSNMNDFILGQSK